MLDENNSLLTAVSEEEAATVSGGTVTYTYNPDGTITVNGLSSGEIFGKNVIVGSSFKLGALVGPVSLAQTTPTPPNSTSTSTDPNNPKNIYVGLTPGV
ncbi:MAG: hypothetical protein DSM106950_30980 [Stigonema ocellatum SAG 48.90 = DSM 106950]|nr:hypothetical protein [Stigonema ocellatum SAG 48.90 = DSM 106950]